MKKSIALLLAAVLCLSLCACGSSAKAYDSAESEIYQYANSAAEAPMLEPASEEYGGGLAVSGKTDNTSAQNSSGGDSTTEIDPDKIIYSANVTLETTEFDETVKALDALIAKYGGWVESSSVNGSNYYNKSRGYVSNRSASYSIRIPSDKYPTLMNSFSTLGNVPYTYTYTDNISAQYYDAQARLNAYKTQETRLLEMMEDAASVSDLITIESRLSELRYEIESLESTLRSWDRQVSYSSVIVDVQEVTEYTPETETKISYIRQLWLALKSGLKTAADFLKDLLLFLAEALPTLIVLAVLAVILVPLFKRFGNPERRAARKAKRAEKAAVKAAARAAKKAAKKSGQTTQSETSVSEEKSE